MTESDVDIKEIQPDETVVADYFAIEFCEHGHAAIYFFWEGRKAPFAIAYVGPDGITEVVKQCTDNMKPQGSA